MRADGAMERPIIGKYRNYFWCVILATFLLWFLLLYFYDTTIMVRKNPVTWFGDNSIDSNSQDSRFMFIDKNPKENVQKTGDFAESVQKTGDFADSVQKTGDFEESVQKTGDFAESVQNTGDFAEGVQKTGDFAEGVQKTGDFAESVKNTGDFAESVQKTGDFAEGVQKTGDFAENFQKTGDFAEPIYARTKFGNKPIDVFGVAVDDPNSVSDKESEPGNQNDEETDNEEGVIDSVPIVEKKTESVIRQPRRQNVEEVNCTGKYIYVHHLPRQFNEDLIRDCRSLSDWIDMCPYTSGFGLGPRFEKTDKTFSRTGWYTTNQFMLEIIFYSRMKQYKCLTTNSSLASAIFLPYYAGLDVARYLWGSSISVRDSASLDLVKWLRQRPEWKRMSGRDHFLVAGRITWDFRRLTNEDSAWGNKLMLLPESRNMTVLTIESSPWNNNDIAIPYPTYFHPSSDIEVFQWQNRMRRQRRRVLFSFVGATRPNIIDSIRAEIIEQCIAAGRKCKLLDCNSRGNKCYKPVFVMKTFQNSVFCLQPAGDSYTRRSTFDSILAGCIPVFFHPGSAYVQYLWHLPKDYRKYSVYIPANDIKDGKVSIERILHKIPKGKIMAMREEVLKLIPRVIYADPRSRLETLEDAFDITVKGVLERIERIRREMERGKNSGSDHPEVFSWKYDLFGNVKEHEWDSLFEKT